MSAVPITVAHASPLPLTARGIARFHLPLLLSAWLMTLVGPVLDLALGRTAEPRLHLAAFWLAFSVLLVAQSACLTLPQVTAAALGRRQPFAAIAAGAALLATLASALVLLIAWTPAGAWLFGAVLGAPARTAALARAALAPLALVPPLIVLRGLAAGASLSERRTTPMALATSARVLALAGVTTAVVVFRAGSGAVPAAWALVLATSVEAVLLAGVVFAGSGRGGRAPAAAPERGSRGSAAILVRLALPLAAASLVWTVARPLVGAVLGRMADPELAQAGLGVVLPALMVSCAPLWALLDAALVLPRSQADVRRLARYAALTSLAFTLAIAAFALLPLAWPALARLLAPTPGLRRTVLPALGVLALEPVVLSARAIAQGLLVRARRTGLVLALAPLKLAAMLAAGLAVAGLAPQTNGAMLALALFVGGDAIDAVLYLVAVRRTGAHRLAYDVSSSGANTAHATAAAARAVGPLEEAA